MTRRSYTREYKVEAVRLVKGQGLSCTDTIKLRYLPIISVIGFH